MLSEPISDGVSVNLNKNSVALEKLVNFEGEKSVRWWGVSQAGSPSSHPAGVLSHHVFVFVMLGPTMLPRQTIVLSTSTSNPGHIFDFYAQHCQDSGAEALCCQRLLFRGRH